MTLTPKIPFKAGDDFNLTLTVSNKTTTMAINANNAVVAAQTLYDNQLLLNDQTDEGQAYLYSLLVSLDLAKSVYADSIIVDISDWEISSSMRWITKLIANFSVNKIDPTLGKFTLNCANEETQLWQPRLYDVDIQFGIDDRKISSNTFQIDVRRDITSGGM